jgi:flagellar biosynthesis/type III secretory pathway protein FliH
VAEEKSLYKDSGNFVPDQFAEGFPGEGRKFDLDDFVRQAKSLESDFVNDLEQQRSREDSKTLRGKEGVGEMFSDAMQQMKDQAAQIHEEAREQGYQEGHEGGYQEGAQAVRERFASSLAMLQSLVDDLSQAREKMYPLLEREMVEMVASLAKKVVRTELESKADGIREIVRMAIESVLDRETLTVKVHPDDHKELQDYGQELIQLFHEIKNVSFETHASVAPGHCVVESNFGTVEAGLDHLDQQIDRILHLAPPGPSPAEQPDPSEKPVELDDMAGPGENDAPIKEAEAYDNELGIEPDEPVDPDEPESPA